MNILIDKKSETPIYRQIMDDVISGAISGVYKYGQKLPPERELSLCLGVSRGTVKKAYEELEKDGFVKIIWGSGVFLAKKPAADPLRREAEALLDIISGLEEKGFSATEAEIYLKLCIMKGLGRKKVVAALVDCNPEALAIFEKQLSKIQGLGCMPVLTQDLEKCKNRGHVFGEFDIIFTTTSHYEEISRLLPEMKDRIMKAAVSPDRETIVNLLKINSGAGLFVKSRRFREIVGNNLLGLGVRIADKDVIYEKWADGEAFGKFISGKSGLVMPPLYTMALDGEVYGRLLEFAQAGGKIITFNYLIEKGSLMYIEDRISNLIYNYNI